MIEHNGTYFIFFSTGRRIEAGVAPPLTPDERRELADTMIAAWMFWRDRGNV